MRSDVTRWRRGTVQVKQCITVHAKYTLVGCTLLTIRPLINGIARAFMQIQMFNGGHEPIEIHLSDLRTVNCT